MSGTAIAGDSIGVKANEQSSFSIIGGQVSGGLVGAGASVTIFSVADNVSALADGTLSANNTITVNATLNSDVSLIDLDAAGGFVGIGAAVAVINDTSVVQATLGNVVKASTVSVSANSNRGLDETTGQFGVGAVAAGASYTRVNVGGGTYAGVVDGASIGSSSAVGSLTVTADSTVTPHANTVAISGGIGAFSVNFSFVDVNPEVQAYIGHGATVHASGAVQVLAESTITAEADMFGVAAGGLAVGVSKTNVTVAPHVVAALGNPDDSTSGSVHITAGSLTLSASTPLNGNTAFAKATGSAGALIGVTSTDASVHDNTTVKSFVGNSSVLAVSGAINVTAVETTQNQAEGNSNAFGLVAAGIAQSHVFSDTHTEAFLGDFVTVGTTPNPVGSLSIGAVSTDDNFAFTNAGSGGAIAGAAAVANTQNRSHTTAAVGASDGLHIAGNFDLGADHTAQYNEHITTFAGGLLAGAGASINHEVTADTTAEVGTSATVFAGAVNISAADHAVKQQLPGNIANLDGTTGGLVSGAGVDETATITFHTNVNIDDFASVVVGGAATNNDVFVVTALNTFNIYDQLAFTTGGAISGAAVYARILADGTDGADEAHVTVGHHANLVSSGRMTLAADGNGSIDQEIATNTYGAGTATLGQPTVDLRPDNQVTIQGDATVVAYGDVNLLAGIDAAYNTDFYTEIARFDGFAGSAIPLSDVHAVDNLFEYDTITIESGAHVQTARTANLLTPSPGPNGDTQIAQAKAESWVSDLQHALLGDGALLDYQNATAPSFSYGYIVNNGTVETGISRHQTLILGNSDGSGGWNQATGVITNFVDNGVTNSQSGGITFNTGTESLSSTIVAQIAADQEILNNYGDSNPTLRNYYINAIAQLKAELAQNNLIDPVTGQPLDVHVMTVNIDPVFADAGHIFTQATQLDGGGHWIAPSDASITIQNYTPAFVNIFGLEIPDDNGGLYFNAVLETAATGNSDIATKNDQNLFYMRTILPIVHKSGLIPAAVTPAFADIPTPTTNPPLIAVTTLLDVDLYNANHGTLYPWPNIHVMSSAHLSPNGTPAEGIINNAGTVVLATATTSVTHDDLVALGVSPLPPANSQGSIPIEGPILANRLLISTNGTLLINLPGQTEETGGSPESLWDSPTMGPTVGTYGAGSTTAGGVVAATNSANPFTGATISSTYNHAPLGAGIDATNIIIRASTVNLNGNIQSGHATYTLTLDPATNPQLAADLNALVGHVTQVTPLAHQPSGDFQVYWDPIGNSGRILVSPTRVSGGHVEITGNIVNTGAGHINVLGGYGNITINNKTSYDLQVQRLDVSTPGDGTLLINDTSGIGEVSFDPNARRNPANSSDHTLVVDVASNTIALSGNPGLATGTAVKYDNEGHTSIGGLVNGQTYFIRVLADGTISLYDSSAHANAGGSTGLVDLTGTVTAAMAPVQRFTYTPGNLADGRQAGHVYTTLYQASNGVVERTTDDGVNAAQTDELVGLNTSYSPMSTWRYGWTVGITEQVKAFAIETSSSWIGLISTGSDYHGPFTTTIPIGVPQVVGAGPYYYTANDGVGSSGYAFTSTTIPQGTTTFSSKPLDTTTTWYGTTTITVEHDAVFGQQVLDSHEISGARAVNISFIGDSKGTVTVNSKASVYISGPILNPTGTTTITSSQGSIELANNAGLVGGNRVVLQAKGGIGDVGGALQIDVAPTSIPFDPSSTYQDSGTKNTVNLGADSIHTGPVVGLKTGVQLTYDAEGHSAIGGLTSGSSYFANYDSVHGTIRLYDTQLHAIAGGATGLVDLSSNSGAGTQQRFTITTPIATSLAATSTSGDINLVQVPGGGDLSIDAVQAQSLGTVTISSPGDILVAGSGGQGLVSGGAINLNAQGDVGNSTAKPLVLDSPNATDVAKDRLTLSALGDVYLQEKTGDLRVNSITTHGDVWINVLAGSLLDANNNAHVDTRTEAQLLAGVWNYLQLTDATGYQQRVNAVINSFVSAKEQEYATYWQFRNGQADPSAFDVTYQVQLTQAELDYYHSIGYTQSQIDTLVNSRTAQYHVLHAQYASFDDPIVDTATNSIFLGANTGLQTGDAVTYDAMGNAPIGGLTDTHAYFVFVLDDGAVRLYDSEAHAIAGGNSGLVTLSSGATGSQQRFTFAPAIHFDPTATGIVSPSTETISLGAGNGLHTGDALVYDAQGGTPIGGLTDGQTYYVFAMGDGSVRLYDTKAHALAGGFPTFASFNPSVSSAVDVAKDAIMLGLSSGLHTGDQVTYDAESHSTVGGLTSLSNYYVSVQRVVDTANDKIFVGLGSGLSTGTAVRYDAEGNAVIGGLAQGGQYFAHDNGDGTVSLYDTSAHALAGGPTGLVNLTTSGGGSEQQLTFGSSSSVKFNPTGAAVRFYDSSVNASAGGATGLVDLTSTGAGTENRLIETGTGLAVLAAGASGQQKFVTVPAVQSVA
ncbi:MAG TPA: hypothetical protein VFN80_12320, partial [Acidothermaceae bacterium]|nr:hypothetical protein [Acidothermaceae bacterium]